jgi:predicted nucleotidyltransferase
MAEIPEKITTIINNYIADVRKSIHVDKVILYGSYAKGSFRQDSDVDLAIFSENFNGQKFAKSTSFLLRLARKYNEICLEPIGFDKQDLYTDNPFVKEILRVGQEINV